MRIYQVPIQLDSEEKLFGGVLTLRKMIYLVLCIGFGAMCFISLYRYSMEAGDLIWGLFSVLGWFLAFYKFKGEYDVDKYIVMWLKYMAAVKDWPFIGGDKD